VVTDGISPFCHPFLNKIKFYLPIDSKSYAMLEYSHKKEYKVENTKSENNLTKKLHYIGLGLELSSVIVFYIGWAITELFAFSYLGMFVGLFLLFASVAMPFVGIAFGIWTLTYIKRGLNKIGVTLSIVDIILPIITYVTLIILLATRVIVFAPV
jgi:hypothetical protein